MTPVSIDCNAKGGHPDPKDCNGNGIGDDGRAKHGVPLLGEAEDEGQEVVFAKGSVKVPEGKSKPLKMKITGAGQKLLLAAGKTLKVKLVVEVTGLTGKAQTFKKTIEVEPK